MTEDVSLGMEPKAVIMWDSSIDTRNYYIKNNTGKGVFLNGGNCNIYLAPGDELGIISVPNTKPRDFGDVKKIGEIEIKE